MWMLHILFSVIKGRKTLSFRAYRRHVASDHVIEAPLEGLLRVCVGIVMLMALVKLIQYIS